jgi:hypothetical protein
MGTYTSYAGQIATKLQDYRAKGQKEGSKHRPPPDAAGPDQHESELKAEAEGHLNSEQRLFDNTLTELARSSIEARQKAIELRATYDQLVRDDTALSAIDAELANDRTRLVNAAELRIRADADLRYFRARNDIQEEASFPDSRYWHIGLLFLFTLGEILVNAFFYENSDGLLGGITVATGIAFLNIGAAFALGFGFRFKNLVDVDKKIAGWSCLVAFILLSIFCNSLFAAFRSEYQLVVDASENAQVFQAFQKAWPEALLIFRLDPHFQDHWSFLLFAIGILLSILAFYKGYTFDDRFPGHGRKTRVYRAALEAEAEQQDRVRQKVKELLHHRKAAVQAALHEPTTQVGMLARRIADLTHAQQELDAQSSAIQRDYQMVIEAYRHANTSVRAVDAPAYFKDVPTLSTRIDTSAATRVIADLNTVQEELKALGDQHREQLNAKLKALHEDSSTAMTDTVSAYLAEVAKEAQEAIARRTPTIHRVQAA